MLSIPILAQRQKYTSNTFNQIFTLIKANERKRKPKEKNKPNFTLAKPNLNDKTKTKTYGNLESRLNEQL